MLKKLLILLLLPVAAAAQSTDYGTVKLLRGSQLADGSYLAALEFKLNPGWKTYWRSPGPAGLPPVFDWSGSGNIGDVAMDWPAPEVIDQSGMVTLAYHDGFVLPIHITPEADGPVRIAMSLNFGVCSDICVPAQAVFLTRLDGSADEGVAEINAALDAQALGGVSAGLESISCVVAPQGNSFEITADLAFAEAIDSPYVVIEAGNGDIWIDHPALSTEGAAIHATAPMRYYGFGDMEMDLADLTVSVFGKDRAVEIKGCAG